MAADDLGVKIVNQEKALDSYLSTLLEEIPTEFSDEDATEKHLIQADVQIEQTGVTATAPKIHAVQDLPEKKIDSNKLSVSTLNPLSVMPEWSQQEFSALFFKLDKMILATPVTDLLRTIKLEKAPTQIPGQPSWFMGLLDTNELRIGVLDTGQLIFGKSKGQQRDQEKQPFKSILISHDGRWGLACDEILSIGKLEPEKVRWRTVRQKRPWLIGTVIEELTAIIDIKQLVPHRKSDSNPNQSSY